MMKIPRTARDLTDVLEGELDFYRAFFAMIDKQRERLKSDADHLLPDDFEAVHEVMRRIEASEQILARAEEQEDADLAAWSRQPQVRDMVQEVTDLVRQCHGAAQECERMARARLDQYRVELDRMGQGRQLLASLSFSEESPRYVDHRP